MKQQEHLQLNISNPKSALKTVAHKPENLLPIHSEQSMFWLQNTVGNQGLERILQPKRIHYSTDQQTKTLLSPLSTEIQRQQSHKGNAVSASLPKAVSASPSKPQSSITCTNDIPSDQIIREHNVDTQTIEKPGDEVKFSVTFNCNVRSFESVIESTDDKSTRELKFENKPTDNFQRRWQGKKFFRSVGTFMVKDGRYRHRLEKVKFAFRKSKDLYATGEKLVSQPIRVKARSIHRVQKNHTHFSPQNVKSLAVIIASEMGEGNSIEQEAIAWAVRNQMIAQGTFSVDEVRAKFGDSTRKPATKTSSQIAQKILQSDISNDITGGAIKWFSPKSMDPSKHDTSGGEIVVTDLNGKKQKRFAPGFHKSMVYVNIKGVREWLVRFYRL